MALWRCKRCTTLFAVGLHCCPQCTGTDVEEDRDMPKISKHGGATNAAEGSEQPSAGNSSETSPEKPPTNDAPSEADRPKPARTTGSRSAKGRRASSSAPSTATSGRETDGE